jgi:hypothetical protein
MEDLEGLFPLVVYSFYPSVRFAVHFFTAFSYVNSPDSLEKWLIVA